MEGIPTTEVPSPSPPRPKRGRAVKGKLAHHKNGAQTQMLQDNASLPDMIADHSKTEVKQEQEEEENIGGDGDGDGNGDGDGDEEEVGEKGDNGGDEQTKREKEKKSERKAQVAATLPPYPEMIKDAIFSLKEKTGSSIPAIMKFLQSKYQDSLPPNFKKKLTKQVKSMSEKGMLTRMKNSFKLSDELKNQKKLEHKKGLKQAVSGKGAKPSSEGEMKKIKSKKVKEFKQEGPSKHDTGVEETDMTIKEKKIIPVKHKKIANSEKVTEKTKLDKAEKKAKLEKDVLKKTKKVTSLKDEKELVKKRKKVLKKESEDAEENQNATEMETEKAPPKEKEGNPSKPSKSSKEKSIKDMAPSKKTKTNKMEKVPANKPSKTTKTTK